MMNKDVLFSSKTDLWETPQDFFDMLDAEFGFTLDAAASSGCRRWSDGEADV